MRAAGADGVLNSGGESGELSGDRGLINVVPYPHPQTGDERGVGACDRGDWPAVLLRHGGGDVAKDGIADRTGVFDQRATLGELIGDQAVIGFQHHRRIGGSVLLHVIEDTAHQFRRNQPVDQTQLEEPAGELLGLFVVSSHEGKE